jgi:aminomethyltransferase
MLQTPLIGYHKDQGARLVEFAGWEMPIMYRGIRDEHDWTRQHASLFDVSHMGRLYLRGARTAELLEHVCTRRIGDMAVGQSRYSHVCRADGGILDDIIVSKLDDCFLVVCNASNRDKIVGWLNEHRAAFGVELEDRTLETAMAAVQGPEAIALLDELLPMKVSELKRYHFRSGSVMGVHFFVARSGYTGEDGAEVILPAKFAMMAVNMLTEKSAARGKPIKPAGLGARDTLRLEAAMPLYGHELTEQWDPITAGQKWCVALDKPFVGSEVLQRVAAAPERTVAGFELDGKRIAREGARVFADGRDVGFVTSGTHSPTLDRVIAMGLVETAVAAPGTAVEVDIRGQRSAARGVPLPICSTSAARSRRTPAPARAGRRGLSPRRGRAYNAAFVPPAWRGASQPQSPMAQECYSWPSRRIAGMPRRTSGSRSRAVSSRSASRSSRRTS